MKKRNNLTDVKNETYVIAFAYEEEKLNLLDENQKKELYNEFDRILLLNQFKYNMYDNIVFNNSNDAVKAFKVISLHLAKSWVKIFIKKINVFKVEENSCVIDLLEKNNMDNIEKPEWFDNIRFIEKSF